MALKVRNYSGPEDYYRVSEFLTRHHRPGNRDRNWLEPMWEYMHFHPMFDSTSVERIGIWEDAGEIVAMVNYESTLGEAFFQFHPAYHHLHVEMLDYAETHLTGVSQKDGRTYLAAFVPEDDAELRALVQARGYEVRPEGTRPLYRFDLPDPFPAIPLAEGFRLSTLAEECDWAKVHTVLWRGFNHGDHPPMNEEEFEDRRKMFDTPTARRDLKVVVVAPDGEFAAFTGMFYDATHRFGYVEPVATVPAYRRRGLGRAAVLEGIRRCGELGATVAYVGSDQAFYQAIGFYKVFDTECWVRYFA